MRFKVEFDQEKFLQLCREDITRIEDVLICIIETYYKIDDETSEKLDSQTDMLPFFYRIFGNGMLKEIEKTFSIWFSEVELDELFKIHLPAANRQTTIGVWADTIHRKLMA